MKSLLQIAKKASEQQIREFFQASAGQWRSERRYYTLPQGEIKEMESIITVQFLEVGSEELQHLAQIHQLSEDIILACGAKVTWDSTDILKARQESQGVTLFGAAGNTLYRDRGFATSKAVTAQYYFSYPSTLCLRTEYHNSVFEEEIKLVGNKYRTRQTIISRAGEQVMIGQYLEKRIEG
ncbi:MAG TPA: phycobiliprotein lyase [Nostocaceae cyanobacterium]|nr:phycobiliprotein lyase [Nostocaceae cyanobacterium]